MNSRNFFRFLLPAVLLLGAVSARTGYADWYHDATTNYHESVSWLEKSEGDWHTKPWYLVGGEGDESCCSKSAESDPLYLDGTSGSVSNEIIVCRNLARNEVQGSFHIRADLGDDPDFGFRSFALYDFCDEDDDHPDGVREIIRFGIRGKEELVCRVCGDDDYTTIQNGSLDDADDGKPYEIGVDYNLSWVRAEEQEEQSVFRFSLMDGYRDSDPNDDNWVPYRFDVRFDDGNWEVNAIGLIASKGTANLFSSVYVNTDPEGIPGDLRAPDPYDPEEPLPVRYEWGDEDGRYSIGSLDQLESFAVALENCSFPYSTFTLIADIDCEGMNFPTGEFAGTFDGQGHVISNLCVEVEGGNRVGLFGTLSGTVSNLLLVNPVVKGSNYVGVLAGEIAGEDARVSRCGVIGAAVAAHVGLQLGKPSEGFAEALAQASEKSEFFQS